MPAETTAARYRRLAQECLDVAASFPDRDSVAFVQVSPCGSKKTATTTLSKRSQTRSLNLQKSGNAILIYYASTLCKTFAKRKCRSGV